MAFSSNETVSLYLSNISCRFSRWDNGETEKLSPWDVEPIGDDGESF